MLSEWPQNELKILSSASLSSTIIVIKYDHHRSSLSSTTVIIDHSSHMKIINYKHHLRSLSIIYHPHLSHLLSPFRSGSLNFSVLLSTSLTRPRAAGSSDLFLSSSLSHALFRSIPLSHCFSRSCFLAPSIWTYIYHQVCFFLSLSLALPLHLSLSPATFLF